MFDILRQNQDGCNADERETPGHIRVHVLTEVGAEPLGPAAISVIKRAASRFKACGIEVIPKRLPGDVPAVDDLLKLILCHDMARHHGGDRDREGDRMSRRVRSMIDRGRKITPLEYEDACARALEIASHLEDVIQPGGLFLAAATIDVAPPATQGTGSRAPQRLWTLAGMPAITVPYGKAEGLPIGVQLIARRGNDDLVLSTAQLLGQDRR